MNTNRLRMGALATASLAALIGCGDDGGDGGGDEILPPDATFVVTGEVVDLETGEPIDGTATVIVEGLQSNPTVSVTGSTFAIEVPANSTFSLLAGSPPNYRATYNAAVEVGASDLSGLSLVSASEDHLGRLATDFGVTPTNGEGIVVLRLVDEQGAPVAGVPGADLLAPEGSVGPFFLDADNAADPVATETSSSGLVLFFDVSPGTATLTSAPDAELALVAPDSPVAGTAVSYIVATAVPGEAIEIPVNVSLVGDVIPILSARGCVSCHDGGGIGKDLGGLHFNGSGEKTFRELVEELSPTHGTARVDLQTPENSLMLNLPRCQALTCPPEPDAPVAHPFATFTGPGDPGYLTILVWIREGALNN